MSGAIKVPDRAGIGIPACKLASGLPVPQQAWLIEKLKQLGLEALAQTAHRTRCPARSKFWTQNRKDSKFFMSFQFCVYIYLSV
jgi:hypothetical protein